MSQILFVFTQLNGFKYFYQTLIIQFTLTHMFAQSELVLSIVI